MFCYAKHLVDTLLIVVATLCSISLQIIARSIMFLFGWKGLSDVIIAKINKHPRSILVFSHTSYVDFFVLIVYLLAYGRYLGNVRTLVKPQPFKYAGFLLRSLGCIPSTKIEDNNGGAIKRITEELSQLNDFKFLICPKGTIINKPWKKGYYYIGKNLNAQFLVIGFDYEQKSIFAFNSYNSEDYEEQDIRNILQKDISKIVPLFPEDEVVPIRKHNKDLRGVIDWCWCSKVIAVIYFSYIIISS